MKIQYTVLTAVALISGFTLAATDQQDWFRHMKKCEPSEYTLENPVMHKTEVITIKGWKGDRCEVDTVIEGMMKEHCLHSRRYLSKIDQYDRQRSDLHTRECSTEMTSMQAMKKLKEMMK